MKSARQAFPWSEVMQFGFGTLKLAPPDFWNMTMCEMQAAMKSHFSGQGQPISRQGLANLMKQHPDTSDRFVNDEC